MAVNIKRPLQSALTRLRAERQRIDQQIKAIEGALKLNGGQVEKGERRRARRGRKRMSTPERRAVSRRMKAYWAKRRGRSGKARKKAA